jgi:hypothetical protein
MASPRAWNFHVIIDRSECGFEALGWNNARATKLCDGPVEEIPSGCVVRIVKQEIPSQERLSNLLN